MSRALLWMIGAIATAGGCMNDSITGQVDGDADADAEGDANADELLSVLLEAADGRPAHIPGVAIGVVHRGEARVGVRGVLDATSSAPLTAASVFDAGLLLAGILDAIAILEAHIDVDRPVTDPELVPDLVVADGPFGDERDLLVRHLLDDSSGLTANVGLFGCSPLSLEDFWTLSPQPALLWNPGELAPGGAIWSKSLAGLVLERHEGRPYPDIVQALVFEPVGMTDATFSPDDPEREYAEPHSGRGIPIARDVDCPSRKPMNQVFASVQDVTALAAWLLHQDRVREALVEQPVAAFRAGFPQGFGLFVGEILPGVQCVAMATSAEGHHASMFLLPDHGFAVIDLMNSDSADGWVLEGALLTTALEVGLGLHLLPNDESRLRSEWGRYAGTYRPAGGQATLVVTWNADDQVLQYGVHDEAQEWGPWPLTPFYDVVTKFTYADWFDAGDFCNSLCFWRDAADDVDRAFPGPGCLASYPLFYRVQQ